MGPYRFERQRLAQGIAGGGKSRVGRARLEGSHLHIAYQDIVVLIKAYRLLYVRQYIVDRSR